MRSSRRVVLCTALLLLGCGSSSGKGGAGPDVPATGGTPTPPDTTGAPQPPAPIVCSGDSETASGAADLPATGGASSSRDTSGAPQSSPPPSQCAGLTAPAAVAMRQHVVSRGAMWCEAAVGDANGALAFPTVFSSGMAFEASVEFATTTGEVIGVYGSRDGMHLLQQPEGFAATSQPRYGHGPPTLSQLRWDSEGRLLPAGSWWAPSYEQAADPNGGVLVAGDVSPSNLGTLQRAAVMFEGGGMPYRVRWGPTPLASSGRVLGAGVDALGRSIVMTEGTSRFAPGTVSGQWFDRDGAAMTGEFLLLDRSIADPCKFVWLETSPLVGGGVVVRRMAERFAPFVEAQALAVVSSGAGAAQPAPDWMTSRPGTRLELFRGGKGYAVLPYGARRVNCAQRIELLAPDGTSCTSIDLPISDGTCDTGELSVGADGTVVQQLPVSMETFLDVGAGDSHTCTWRFWPQALR